MDGGEVERTMERRGMGTKLWLKGGEVEVRCRLYSEVSCS